jgi:hypothetical protein
MAKRPCVDCGTLTDQTRCPAHRAQKQRARDQQRGSSTARGYDQQHERLRQAWQPEVDAGSVICWRCNKPIEAGSAWHLGHDDHDRNLYRGPEHVRCNCATSGRVGGTPVTGTA